MHIDNYFIEIILKATGAKEVIERETIQELWSGYGKIIRCELVGSKIDTIIVKHVRLPKRDRHPRGWNTDLSHKRKLRSYQVETSWYRQFSSLCTDSCRVPRCLALKARGDEVLIVLEDLDDAGFPARKRSVNMNEIKTCLSWLANFHAVFMGKKPDNLWKTGTYWHLDTRPDELEVLKDTALKNAASAIDLKLKNTTWRTFVHGDAKLANFCFSPDGFQVAAVDFQYVGGGCGMKDVAYFIGSCLHENECEKQEQRILDYYFQALKEALAVYHKDIDGNAVEKEWRPLYHTAWTDFHRFLKGWSPGHWKINSYSERLVREEIKKLQVTSQERL